MNITTNPTPEVIAIRAGAAEAARCVTKLIAVQDSATFEQDREAILAAALATVAGMDEPDAARAGFDAWFMRMADHYEEGASHG
ncbi:MAG: hypothetical protein HXX19_18465 [Rhodoferax sp.]|nr:hypothetical protein [Rhodoferax sp.]